MVRAGRELRDRVREDLRGRAFEAVSASALNFVQSVQIELDKILVLLLAGQVAAGIYALAFRVIDLTSTPVKSFFTIYAQALLRRRSAIRDFALSLRIEGGIVVLATALYASFILVLSMNPDLLGSSVARAYPFLDGLWIIPAMKLLVDYHRELFFSANRLAWFAGIAAVLGCLKIFALVAIVSNFAAIESWTWPLSLLFVLLYLISAASTWRLIFARPASSVRSGAAPVAAT